MELFSNILLALIFLETSILLTRNTSKKTSRGAKNARRIVFVDTSTLMDGRILAVARAGFLGDDLRVPRSVIRELQLLADGQDSEKRSRARYGLDVVTELERVENAEVSVFADAPGSRIKVDERLLELAREYNGVVLTNDFNLAKVAATEGILAININELAQGLRSEYLPGDHINVRIISAGSNPKQGVAYLPDGTMVVVDDGEKYVGENFPVEIEFIRYLQTNAGKMMFAKIVEAKKEKKLEVPAKAKKVNGRKPQAKSEVVAKAADKAEQKQKKAATEQVKAEEEQAKAKSVEAKSKTKKAEPKQKKANSKPKKTNVKSEKNSGKKAKTQTKKASTKKTSDEPSAKKTRRKTRESKAEDSLISAANNQVK